MSVYLLVLLVAISTAQLFLFSRPLNINSLPVSVSPFYSISLSSSRLLILSRSVDVSSLTSFHLHLLTFDHAFITTSTTLFSPSNCITQIHFSFHPLDFQTSNLSFVHLKTGLLSILSEDIILIAFEFYSSNLNNQFDQLSLKVFSLLNLQESNTFEFSIENDLMSLYFNEFSLEQDQSIIANITITHNSNQCTTEFPHEAQFNSIVSCSFCISNTGYTNTSSLQIIDKSIELQTNGPNYCSFLKESVPLFLFVSDYKLVIRDVIQRNFLEIATPLSGVRSVDYISTTDSKSLFMVLICNENNCQIRHLELTFDFDEFEYEYHVISLAAGEAHSAAVLADGTVKTWGWGASGRLGHGNTETQMTPTTVADINDAVTISCGKSFTLGLRANGKLFAFGYNTVGQLGDNSVSPRNKPVDVLVLSNVIAISVGEAHSLALTQDQSVYSFGASNNFELGRIPVGTDNRIPVVIPGLDKVIEITAGDQHSLAVRVDGSVVSWGFAGNGRLGNGKTASTLQLEVCGSFTSAKSVSAGTAHSLVLLENGELWVMGSNTSGQLGIGTTVSHSIPIHLNGYKFTKISSGGNANIGILIDGRVVTFGNNNHGQLGISDIGYKSSPVHLQGLDGVYSVVLGTVHGFVASVNGSVYGFGNNGYGRLGDGTSISRNTPTLLPALFPDVE
ncbi:hypothetical protein RCL1_004927 [Eukaryota sp. TZLM3-RCL]